MNKTENATAERPSERQNPAAIVEREAGLHQDLSPAADRHDRAWASAIGTGLFLGSAISVKLAGPAVILSFVGGACIAVTMMWALAENGGGASSGRIVRTLCGDVLASVGGICRPPHLLVLHDGSRRQ